MKIWSGTILLLLCWTSSSWAAPTSFSSAQRALTNYVEDTIHTYLDYLETIPQAQDRVVEKLKELESSEAYGRCVKGEQIYCSFVDISIEELQGLEDRISEQTKDALRADQRALLSYERRAGPPARRFIRQWIASTGPILSYTVRSMDLGRSISSFKAKIKESVDCGKLADAGRRGCAIHYWIQQYKSWLNDPGTHSNLAVSKSMWQDQADALLRRISELGTRFANMP